MKNIALLSAVALLGACTGSSEIPDAPPLPQLSKSADEAAVPLDGSLVAYVDNALASRPELTASVQRWRAQKSRIDTIDELPSPTLSYGYFIQSVETRVGPQRHRANIQQPIPWPGKANARADVERAKELVEATRYDAHALDIAWQVTEAYWRLWEIERIHVWHEEHVAILESLAGSARARVEIGDALIADVGQMELERSRATDLVSEAHENHWRASIELAWAAGLEIDKDVLSARAATPTARLVAETEEALVAAAQEHPRVLALLKMQEARKQEVIAARTARYPDFGVGLDWIETGPAADPNMEGSGKDPIIAGVSVKLPLFVGESRAMAEAAEAERLALVADEEIAKRDAARAVRQSLASLRDTARRIKLYETTLLPQAESVLGSVRGAYEVGRTSIASLLHAQHALLEVRIGLVRAHGEHQREWARLERLVARPVRGKEVQ